MDLLEKFGVLRRLRFLKQRVFILLCILVWNGQTKEFKFALCLLTQEMKSVVNLLVLLCLRFNLSSKVIKTLISQIFFM